VGAEPDSIEPTFQTISRDLEKAHPEVLGRALEGDQRVIIVGWGKHQQKRREILIRLLEGALDLEDAEDQLDEIERDLLVGVGAFGS
jgi:hypothetical protein